MKKENKVLRIRILPIVILLVAIVVICCIANPETTTYVKNLSVENYKVGADDDLQQAINNASDGSTITLSTNMTISGNIEINKNLTIDLDDSNIEIDGYIIIGASAQVTIKNGGILYNGSTENINLIDNSGTLTLQKLNLINNKGTGLKNTNNVIIKGTEVKVEAKTPFDGKINTINSTDYAFYISGDDVKTAELSSYNDLKNKDYKLVFNNIAYKDLDSAFENLSDNSEEENEITLIDDYDEYEIKDKVGIEAPFISIEDGKKVQLDLNNKTLTLKKLKKDDNNALILNNGSLKIKNGNLYMDNAQGAYKVFLAKNNGELEMDNLVMSKGFYADGLFIKNNSTINFIDDVNLGDVEDTSVENNGTINIKGTLNAGILKNVEAKSKISINMESEDDVFTGEIQNNNANALLEILKGTVTANANIKNNYRRVIDNSGIVEIGNKNDDNTYINENVKIEGNVLNRSKVTMYNGLISTDSNSSAIYNYNNILGTEVITIIENGKIINDSNLNQSGREHEITDYSLSTDYYALAGYGDNTFYIKRGIIASNKGGAIYSSLGTVKVGLDDQKVEHEIPLIKGEKYGISGDEDKITITMCDGIIYGKEKATNVDAIFPSENQENNNYYKENYLIKGDLLKDSSSNYNGYYYLKLSDKKGPTASLSAVSDHNTCNSIKLKINATDTGDGVQKFDVIYQNQESTDVQTKESIKAENGDNYYTLVGLESNKTYKIKVKVYDLNGNTCTSGEIITSTTSGINEVTLNKTSTTLNVGESEELTATIDPSNATNKYVGWTSSNSDVAEVDEDGLVTAKGKGTATITVTTEDGGKIATCNVTVNAPRTEIIVLPGRIVKEFNPNNNTFETWAQINPKGTSYKNIVWASDNTQVAEVEGKGLNTDGFETAEVTIKSLGIANITVTAEIGEETKTSTCKVIVIKPLKQISIKNSPTKTTYTKGESLNLTGGKIEVTYEDNSTQEISMSSEGVTVTGYSANTVGEQTITVIYGGKTTTFKVTVNNPNVPVTGVTLNKNNMSLEVGKDETLTATINPTNATNKNVTWSSDNSAVATVENGKVTAITPGTATITVTTVDGGKTATCEVTVNNPNVPVTGVTLNKNKMTLEVDGNETLTATVNPTNATNKNVTWSSDNSAVATVQNGKVTAITPGTATITVTTVDGGKTATCEVTVNNPNVPVTGVTLNKNKMTLEVDGNETLTATVNPTNATNKNVTWSSDNSAVATVQNGTVTAIAPGTATITVTTVDGGKTATCEVTVNNPNVPVTGVTLNKNKMTLEVDGNETLTATVNPTNATNKNVTWSSDNSAVATVENGKVTAITPGTATITVTTVDGGKTATCEVTVNNPNVPVTGVTLNKNKMTLEVDGNETLTATVNPTNATNKNVTWSSDNSAVATVQNGKVTAITPGTATITVTTVDGGKTATCEVTVNNPNVPVTGVTLNKNKMTLEVDGNETLTATVNPTNATNKNVTWSSDNSAVATVQNGTVTAIAPGTATITVTTEDGGKTATCEVTVNNPNVPVTGVTLNKNKMTLEVDGNETLTATVNPTNATNKNVTWSSDNSAVATVQNGKVTAIAPGTATITVTTEDGGKTATCEVTVNNPNVPVTGVTLNKNKMTLEVDGNETLTATVNPTNATNKNVTWTSDNPTVATVQNGKVTAIAPGTATITVTTVDGGKTATCEVTVNNPNVAVTGVTLNKNNMTLEVGKDETLTATINPTNATNKNVTWTSNTPTVATVQNGKVTAIAQGTATITVTTEDGEKTAQCLVKVVNQEVVVPTSIVLNKTSLSLKVGENAILSATIKPDNAIQDVSWTSSNPAIAAVDGDGRVKALSEGKTTITAEAGGGKKATCLVTVEDDSGDEYIDLKSISLDISSTSLKVGDSTKMSLRINPEDASIEKIDYTSSNTNVATIDNSGNIKAVGVGTSTITVVVKDKNGNVKTASKDITVTSNSSNNQNNNNNNQNNDKNSNDKKSGDSQNSNLANKILPKTGLGKGIMAFVIIILTGGIAFIKYRNMRDIK